jgi:hypothetical protein
MSTTVRLRPHLRVGVAVKLAVKTRPTGEDNTGLTSTLFKLARLSADIRAARSPTTLARRVKNKAVGRLLAHAGVWRRLWR